VNNPGLIKNIIIAIDYYSLRFPLCGTGCERSTLPDCCIPLVELNESVRRGFAHEKVHILKEKYFELGSKLTEWKVNESNDRVIY
jgi:hypothetical protein